MSYKALRSKAPPHSILSSDFDYKPSGKTDLRATFRRIRREQQEQAKIEAASNVKPIKRTQGAK